MKIKLLGLILLVGSWAQASIILTNGVAPGVSNVLFNGSGAQSGTSLYGTVLGQQVVFTSSETLNAMGGQAQLDASDGNLDGWLTVMIPGFVFNLIDFNPELKNGLDAIPGGNLVITAVGTVSGVHTFNLLLGDSGNDKFYFTSVGESISSVMLDAASGYNDMKQVRVGGLTAANSPVPEPATWGLLAGALPLLYVARKRLS